MGLFVESFQKLSAELLPIEILRHLKLAGKLSEPRSELQFAALTLLEDAADESSTELDQKRSEESGLEGEDGRLASDGET